MLLFHVKTVVRVELGHLKKEAISSVWQLSGSVYSQYFFTPLGVLLVMKTFQDIHYHKGL